VHEKLDDREDNHGGRRIDQPLKVFGETAVATEPSEETLDDPAARMDREANLIGGLLDDLDGDAGCGCRTLTSIARVGEDIR